MKFTSVINKLRIYSKFLVGFLFSCLGFSRSPTFIILHQGRCGSTLLQDLLKYSYGNSLLHLGEIYSYSATPSLDDGTFFINNLANSSLSSKVSVLELKYGIDDHLSLLGHYGVLRLFTSSFKFVVLSRKSILSQAKSLLYSQYSDRYHYSKDKCSAPSVVRLSSPFLLSGTFYHSIDDLADFIERQENFLLDYLDSSKLPYVHIYYEDLVDDPSAIKNLFDSLFGLSGLPFSLSSTRLIPTPIDYSKYLYVE